MGFVDFGEMGNGGLKPALRLLGMPQTYADLTYDLLAMGFEAAAVTTAVKSSQVFKLYEENGIFVDILSPQSRKHILYGDGGAGGHLWPGLPGKTPFPESWSGDKIIHSVGDIVTSPNSSWYAQTGTGGKYTAAGDPAKWVTWQERDGVRMRVVFEPATDRVVTSFPDTAPIPNLIPIP